MPMLRKKIDTCAMRLQMLTNRLLATVEISHLLSGLLTPFPLKNYLFPPISSYLLLSPPLCSLCLCGSLIGILGAGRE